MTTARPGRADRSSRRRPRVLHVAHHALPHPGGLEKVVDVETSLLAARGWPTALLTSATGTRPGVTSGPVRTVRVRAWNGLEHRFGVPFPLYGPGLLAATLRAVRRADLVHVHDLLYLTSWVAALCCRLLRRPYVVHRHVGLVHHPAPVVDLVQRLVLRTAGRFVLGGAATAVAIDDHVARSLSPPAGVPVRVLRNGVDTSAFRPPLADERTRLRRRYHLPPDEPVVLFVGRFVPKKGFSVVAGAASDAYRLAFVGGDRPAGVTDERISFLGTRPAAEMPEVYRCADLVVVASVGECPLTVLEALSSGVPVVANDQPALRTPWTEGPGVVFADMESPDSLRRALEAAVGDLPRLREEMASARERVCDSFSWQVHGDHLEALYRDVLAPSPAPAG